MLCFYATRKIEKGDRLVLSRIEGGPFSDAVLNWQDPVVRDVENWEKTFMDNNHYLHLMILYQNIRLYTCAPTTPLYIYNSLGQKAIPCVNSNVSSRLVKFFLDPFSLYTLDLRISDLNGKIVPSGLLASAFTHFLLFDLLAVHALRMGTAQFIDKVVSLLPNQATPNNMAKFLLCVHIITTYSRLLSLVFRDKSSVLLNFIDHNAVVRFLQLIKNVEAEQKKLKSLAPPTLPITPLIGVLLQDYKFFYILRPKQKCLDDTASDVEDAEEEEEGVPTDLLYSWNFGE
jgi:hypothetical protein